MEERSHIVRGRAYVVGDNIDTDQIIPAQYLTLLPTIPEERAKLGSFAMAGLPEGALPFVAGGQMKSEYVVMIAGRNFGCGSSREHAPVALGAAGIRAVVAESYSRIFFRNSIATGELFPCESTERLCDMFSTGDEVEVDIDTSRVTHKASGRTFDLKPLGPVVPVIEAGGLFEYARRSGMMPGRGQGQAVRGKQRRTRIVAFANQKGGVGKTTTVINLAVCLAARKHEVLVVDLDPQCNSTSGLGVQQKKGGSIYGSLVGEDSILEKIQATTIKGLSIVPSEVDLAGAEVDVPRAERYLHRFTEAIAPVVQQARFDFILVDCPPSLGILTMNALAAASSVLIPTQCEYYALEGLAVICRLVEQIRAGSGNSKLEVDGIVMTMYDGRTHLSEEVVEEVRRYFGSKVYSTVIPRNVRLSEAPSYGMAAVDYDPSCSGAKAYKKFSDEFLKRHAKWAEQSDAT
ncbi:MAG: AAA family ATPase [bacterium]